MDTKTKHKWMIATGIASVSVTVILIIFKTIAFFITGSVAVLSSLFDSVQDFMTSLVNMVAIHHSIVPADKQHRFGHGKAQGVGSLIQACIIVMAALILLKESVSHLIERKAVTDISAGIIVSLFALCLTIGLVVLQTWVVKKTNSLSIKTDKAHYTGDILMNVGVIISLTVSCFLGWMWLDGVFGILVGLYLLYAMYNVIQEALAVLMDKELPEKMRADIKAVVLSGPDVLNVSDLKTRQDGNHFFIQCSVQFNGNVTLCYAHQCIDEIEKKLSCKYPECEVIIHAEPFISEDQHGGKYEY